MQPRCALERRATSSHLLQTPMQDGKVGVASVHHPSIARALSVDTSKAWGPEDCEKERRMCTDRHLVRVGAEDDDRKAAVVDRGGVEARTPQADAALPLRRARRICVQAAALR